MNKDSDANGNYHGSDGRFVSLRDYFERVFQDHAREHRQLAEGIRIASVAQDKRLDAMNEFRSALVDQTNRGVTRELFDARVDVLSTAIGVLEKRMAYYAGGAAVVGALLGYLARVITTGNA